MSSMPSDIQPCLFVSCTCSRCGIEHQVVATADERLGTGWICWNCRRQELNTKIDRNSY